MKTKLLFGALAFLAFGLASCSSDAPDSPGGENQTTDGDKYIAFQIRNVGEGTRADENKYDGFEDGVKAEDGAAIENKIDEGKVRFYFFDEKGNPYLMSTAGVSGAVNTNMVKPTALVSNPTNGSDCTIEGTLVLGTPSEGYKGSLPKYMVCAVNLSDGGFDNLKNKTFTAMLDQVSSKTNGEPDTDLFPMTSATYQDNTNFTVLNNNVGFWTELKEEVNIFKTAEDATKSPAHVYVERLAAKVRVTGLKTSVVQVKDNDGNLSDASYTFSDANYNKTNKKLEVRLDNWRTVNNLSTVKYIKNLEPNTDPINGYNWAWNDVSNHRSYWATTQTATTIVNASYNIYKTENWLGEYKGTKDNPVMANCDYIFPNCAYWDKPKKLSDRTTNATGVIVKATIGETIDGDFKPLSFVLWAGNYMTEDDFKEFVAKQHTTEDETFTAKDVSFTYKTGSNKYTVCVGKDSDGNGITCDHFGDVEYWENGVTSYYVNIQHATATKKEDNTTKIPIYGIVRNHIYELNMTDVIGLGIPGNDKKEPDPDTESYVACHIDVLNWHVVSNTVTLE